LPGPHTRIGGSQTRKLQVVSRLLRRPATPALALAAALLAVLGVVAVGYAGFAIAATNPIRPVVGIGTAILLLGYAVLLFAVSRGVYRGRRWSRGPGVATSLIQLPVAWSYAGGQTWWVAAGLAAASVTVLVCLLLPSSTAVFVPSDSRPPEP
jgi:hypothetical protein